jgi:acyl-CoA dehydrogenase
MSERDLVVETVRDVLTAYQPFVLTPQRPWDAELWRTLAEAGMTGIGTPEEQGGSGGEPADAASVVMALAAGAAAVPVGEHLLVARPALLAAGLVAPDPAEPVTVAVDGSVVAAAADGAGRVRLTGRLVHVPWGSVAAQAVVLASTGQCGQAVLAVVDLAGLPVTTLRNLAGEPRSTIELTGVGAAGVWIDAATADAVRARYALLRAVQLTGALARVLDWTVAYASERTQFGRPLGRFQALQMDLARMAGEVSAAAALTDAAISVAADDARIVPAAAAAKIRSGAAVAVVARHGHQVHGAIGFTQEHRLHHLTRRLWAWRDEAGGETYWSAVLGAKLADSPDTLWPRLTGVV